MGRIKTKLIKRTTHKLIETNSSNFDTDYAKNKKRVEAFVDYSKSKKIRNTIAGYITRLKKKSS